MASLSSPNAATQAGIFTANYEAAVDALRRTAPVVTVTTDTHTVTFSWKYGYERTSDSGWEWEHDLKTSADLKWFNDVIDEMNDGALSFYVDKSDFWYPDRFLDAAVRLEQLF